MIVLLDQNVFVLLNQFTLLNQNVFIFLQECLCTVRNGLKQVLHPDTVLVDVSSLFFDADFPQ